MTAEFVEQDMKTEEGYANVLSILESAKESGAAESRCHVAPLPGHEAGSAPKSDFEGETAVLAAVLVALFAFFVCVYRVTIKIMRRREMAHAYGFSKVLDEDEDDEDLEGGGIELGGLDGEEDGEVDDDIGEVFKPEVFNALRKQFEDDFGGGGDDADDLDFGDVKKEDL